MLINQNHEMKIIYDKQRTLYKKKTKKIPSNLNSICNGR